MAESFDAYHEWLGIAPKDQPPNHYRLLGIDLYEAKANVIDSAADRQMAHLRTFQTGARAKLCQELLNKVSTARVLLLDAETKAAYDDQLKNRLAAKRVEPQPRVARAIPLSRPAAPAAAVPEPGSAAPLPPAASAPGISGAPSHRRGRRKQSTPWMALGIGGALLGIVVVIAAMSILGGGDDETADSGPSVRSPKSKPGSTAKKSSATAVTKTSNADTGKTAVEPTVAKKPDEVDPPTDEPAKKEPADDETPIKVIDDNDPPADSPPPDDPQPADTKRTDKAPIPPAAAREKAEAEIRNIFDLDAAISLEAKAALAREILAAALDTADEPASQYVMLRMVRDMSAFHGDYIAAERSIGEMSQRFDVDAIAMRSAALVRALAAKVPAPQRQRVAREGLRLVRECHEADRYREGKAILTAVLRAASRLRDKQMASDARQLRGDGEALAKRYAAVRGAFETLKTKPNDPSANASAGKYVCYVKGDWKRGLAMLVKGNDALLKDLALREQRGVTKLDEQLALANAWWKIADEQPSRTSGEVRTHAGHWYRKALPKLTGLDKLRVQKRLDQAKSLAADQVRVTAKRPRHPADAVQFGGHWYKVFVGRIAWDEARRRSSELGGYLACVERREEANAVGILIQRSGIRNFACVGGFKDPQGRWQWVNGNAITYTNFTDTGPDNAGGKEDRLVVTGSGIWNDIDGGNRAIEGFVVEWDR